MPSLRTTVAFAGLLAMGANAAIQQTQPIIPGYEIVDLSWEVETTPGGPNMTVTGPIEKVVDELLKVNPNFLEEYPETNATGTSSGDLAKRYVRESYFCGGRWPLVKTGPIAVGVTYLRRVTGRPSFGPGPGKCGRVSCSNKGGIYWCNDNTSTKVLNSFGDIADGADYINNNCRIGLPTGSGYADYMTAGQIFFVDKWNVIVRYDDSNGC
ncbi:hypothetical protein QBC35DRAFT_538208 [Podospora australis]|uniref:Ecp2 effector protein domain-containing protein n=1 Tax=Podospora australis TaxID=1536484 RepID=A0AAN6X0A4_9PEZI|nr:hypothetical protein QBC35DRAFT_538208 [Podospora australis]